MTNSFSRQGVKPPRLPGGQLLQKRRFLPQTRRHFQRLRQNFGHGFHLPGLAFSPGFKPHSPSKTGET